MTVPQAPMPPQIAGIATGQQLRNKTTLQKHSRDRRGSPQTPIHILQTQHEYRTTPRYRSRWRLRSELMAIIGLRCSPPEAARSGDGVGKGGTAINVA